MVRKLDPVRHEAKRQQILDAARECFSRKGFCAASISDLCAAARVSPGHLYHYFDSKEAIVRAIVERSVEQSVPVFHQLGKQGDIVAAFVAELGERLKAGAHPRGLLTLDMLAESTRNPAIAAIVRRRDRSRRERLGGLLRTGQQRGQVDRSLDPDIAAAVVSNILETATYMTIRDRCFDMSRGVDMLQTLLARFLSPQPPAATRRARAKRVQRARADRPVRERSR